MEYDLVKRPRLELQQPEKIIQEQKRYHNSDFQLLSTLPIRESK